MSWCLEIPPAEPSSSSTRADVNRQNAQHSTGPRSQESKERVRFNARKHSLSGRTCMLPGDDLEAYNKLGEFLNKSWNPVSEAEFRLVAVLHDTEWRLNRIPALEMDLESDGFLEQYDRFASEEDEDLRCSRARAAAFRANAKLFDQMGRHENRLMRIKKQTEEELQRALAERQAEEDAARKPAKPAQAATVPPFSSPAGFELQDMEKQVKKLISDTDRLCKDYAWEGGKR